MVARTGFWIVFVGAIIDRPHESAKKRPTSRLVVFSLFNGQYGSGVDPLEALRRFGIGVQIQHRALFVLVGEQHEVVSSRDVSAA